jgi:TPR repeat protein
VTADLAQAVVWFQKASDLGDTPSKANLGRLLVEGDARAGVAKDAARGFGLLCETVEEGLGSDLILIAQCYLKGDGVEKDAVHGVALLRQAVEQEDVNQSRAMTALSTCYMTGTGVEADTVQAALWCQRAAAAGDPAAVLNLPLIRKCHFCGTTPARQLRARCRRCATATTGASWRTGRSVGARSTCTSGTAAASCPAAPRRRMRMRTRHRTRMARRRRVRPNLSMASLKSDVLIHHSIRICQ